MSQTQFADKYVLVVGLGRFGGQIAAARWLTEQGARVTVTDLAPAEKLADSLAQLADLPIRYRLGGHDERDLDGCDLLVVSPAVPKDRSDFVKAALARGLPITAEMNLFVERCPARRIIGITGSAGKSTTTAMVGSILEAARRAGVFPQVWMGGNIGHSLLADLTRMTADDAVVLELSSFQLEDLGTLRWSPPVAVITNIQPNHLDRHGTLDLYADAKMNIVRYQGADGIVLIHENDAVVRRYVTAAGADGRIRECRFEPKFEAFLRLPGRHNQLNAAAAVSACRAIGVSDEIIAQGLGECRGLPHRLEFVIERDGVRYYNDSKSTTPESTCIAAEAFAGTPTILLVGGKPKGASFAEMGRLLARTCKHTICYGQAGPEIYEEILRGRAPGTPASAVHVSTFAEAVERARQMAVAGDVVVLSPACASYDEFTNYEERGEAFRRLVSR
ncbi:MAG TPA: UDP-N-acetylmuramoyl-L-alanine--D-glutamate ligase [Phycisphaerae bacterium]|nr:UDP-N-acetylmuramoyl-L-alanine--D-glutamate ligase [Phycisphaerae bacterium]HQE28247.1 UDP-N-acetylmuramoyl-L-alanine--D-glutamate ligase [Phycisphaerae bacterium]